jgi:hypothetical protein
MRCDYCKQTLADDAPIWRLSTAHYTNRKGLVRNICRDCGEQVGWIGGRWPHPWLPPQPCQQCGRPVHWSSKRQRPKYFVCDDACARKLYYPRQRGLRACARCGEQFTPQRGDARFCSNACRQANHRRRARAEG